MIFFSNHLGVTHIGSQDGLTLVYLQHDRPLPFTGVASGDKAVIPLPQRGIYIVKSGNSAVPVPIAETETIHFNSNME